MMKDLGIQVLNEIVLRNNTLDINKIPSPKIIQEIVKKHWRSLYKETLKKFKEVPERQDKLNYRTNPDYYGKENMNNFGYKTWTELYKQIKNPEKILNCYKSIPRISFSTIDTPDSLTFSRYGENTLTYNIFTLEVEESPGHAKTIQTIDNRFMVMEPDIQVDIGVHQKDMKIYYMVCYIDLGILDKESSDNYGFHGDLSLKKYKNIHIYDLKP